MPFFAQHTQAPMAANSKLAQSRPLAPVSQVRTTPDRTPHNQGITGEGFKIPAVGYDFAERVPCSQSSSARLLRAPISAAPVGLQAKLTVNQPDDPYEREAETVAKQVMRMPEPTLQRVCSCGGLSGSDGKCEECKKKEIGLQRIANGPARSNLAPPIVHQVLRSPGQPLDQATRASLEPRFGHDFSRVRVHTDAKAADSARAVAANAYTVGRDIVFGDGRYAPRTEMGDRLLAHELTHVVQQDFSQNHGNLTIGPIGDAYEHQADQIAAAFQSPMTPLPTDWRLVRRSGVIQRDRGSDDYHQGYQDGVSGKSSDASSYPRNEAAITDYDAGYAKGHDEFLGRSTSSGAASAPVCTTAYHKAASFQELIDLVRATETRLSKAGITSPKDQIHAIRGVFYGTNWSLDFSVEKSTTRNEGFQRFTRPSESPEKTIPLDIRNLLDCNLFAALQASQDLVDGSRRLDFGHLVIGLDARSDPKLSGNYNYPYLVTSVDMGGSGTELVTWLGDLGGGAAKLAIARAAVPSTNVSTIFSGPPPVAGAPPYSDYGAAINLEGDLGGFVVATGSATSLTMPSFAPGKSLSDALQDYLSPGSVSASWKTRATTFLQMYGATFDASGTLSNRAALVSKFSAKIQVFACNYLASRVKDRHIPFTTAKNAVVHVIPGSDEVALAFVDALDDSRITGATIEAKRFPAPKGAGASTCGLQIATGGALGVF